MDQFTRPSSIQSTPVAKPAGGFRLVSVNQLCMIWWGYISNLIGGYLGLRAYLALHEVDERRRAAERGRRNLRQSRTPSRCLRSQILSEVHALVGGAGGRCLTAAVRRLERVGLVCITSTGITFASDPSDLPRFDTELASLLDRVDNRIGLRQRRIPMPRRMLRYLAAGAPAAVTATAFAFSIRCLWLKRRACDPYGTCSSAFVSRVFGLHPRTVKTARKHLRDLGWVTPVPTNRRSVQRHGACWQVDLFWSPTPVTVLRPARKSECTESPPPRPRIRTGSPPPKRNLQLPSGSKNQNPAAGGPAGVCNDAAASRPPTLRNVVAQDLRDPRRLDVLFTAAIEQCWMTPSENDRLRFFAAAEHARRHATRNPSGLFMFVVKNAAWHLLTNADEDAARRLLAADAERPRHIRSHGRVGRRSQQDAVDGVRTELLIQGVVEHCSISRMFDRMANQRVLRRVEACMPQAIVAGSG